YDNQNKLPKLFQTLDFLQYLNVDIPANVDAFYLILKGYIFELIYNPWERDEDNIFCNLHYKLSENELKCLLTNNLGSVVTFILIII
ncbi:hypothetical protein ABK046_48100, partial [Streptomyces caeruleatus]